MELKILHEVEVLRRLREKIAINQSLALYNRQTSFIILTFSCISQEQTPQNFLRSSILFPRVEFLRYLNQELLEPLRLRLLENPIKNRQKMLIKGVKLLINTLKIKQQLEQNAYAGLLVKYNNYLYLICNWLVVMTNVLFLVFKEKKDEQVGATFPLNIVRVIYLFVIILYTILILLLFLECYLLGDVTHKKVQSEVELL